MLLNIQICLLMATTAFGQITEEDNLRMDPPPACKPGERLWNSLGRWVCAPNRGPPACGPNGHAYPLLDGTWTECMYDTSATRCGSNELLVRMRDGSEVCIPVQTANNMEPRTVILSRTCPPGQMTISGACHDIDRVSTTEKPCPYGVCNIVSRKDVQVRCPLGYVGMNGRCQHILTSMLREPARSCPPCPVCQAQ